MHNEAVGVISAIFIALVGWLFSTSLSSTTRDPQSTTASSSSSPSSRIRASILGSHVVFPLCQAHAANVAITGPEGHAMANLIHEVLGLDLSIYPFDNIQSLATREPTRYDHTNEHVSRGWSQALSKIGRMGYSSTQHHQEQLRFAVDLAVRVFSQHETRLVYVRDIWPRMVEAKAGGWTTGKSSNPREKMLQVMDLWCIENGFTG